MASTTTLDGLYKQIYADKISNLVPECAVIYKEVGFSEKTAELGGFYNQPVILGQEQGFSFFAPDTSAPTLTGAVDMSMKNAQVGGFQVAGQSSLTVEAAKRAVAKGPSAFEDAVGLQMRNLKESAVKRLEILFLYGQAGIGNAGTNANVNATTTDVTITLADWSAGIWSGLVGARLDLYQAGTYGLQTKVNSVGPLTISRVNVATRVVRLTGAAADITALGTYVSANANLGQFFFAGAYNNEMAGLQRQIVKPGSMFGIDPASFDLWQGNSYAVGSPFAFTFKEMQKAVALAAGRGLDEDVTVLVNTNTWANLLSDQAALRQYVQSTDTFQNGATELVFMSQNGKLIIKPHLYVKESHAFIVPMKQLVRVGATDVTFDLPGTDKGRIFIQNPSSLAFEYRCYSNQSLFLPTPAKAVFVSAIQNT